MMNSAARALRGPNWMRWIASTGAKLPTANTIVANRISHGTRLEKIAVGGPQQQKCPDQPADEAQNEQAQEAEFGDREDIAAIRPCARKRSRKQRDHARCIRIDGITGAPEMSPRFPRWRASSGLRRETRRR